MPSAAIDHPNALTIPVPIRPAAQLLVPIHHGTPTFHECDIGPFRITELRFAPGTRIEPHHHDRANIGVILGGSFDLTFGPKLFSCEPGTAFVEPAEETHCNCMGCRGAWVLAIQPDPAAAGLSDAKDLSLNRPSHERHPHGLQLARRIAREIRAADPFTPLVVQGLAFELIGFVARSCRGARKQSAALDRVEERLRSEPVSTLRLADLAAEAGIHPAHLTRQFRTRHGRSLGTFLLEQRLEWTALQLTRTDRPIAAIALDAGFADQSHFTHRFREYTGLTPRRFRLRVGVRSQVSGSEE